MAMKPLEQRVRDEARRKLADQIAHKLADLRDAFPTEPGYTIDVDLTGFPFAKVIDGQVMRVSSSAAFEILRRVLIEEGTESVGNAAIEDLLKTARQRGILPPDTLPTE